jgi:hypothetical protein
MLFTLCIFLQSIHQPINAINDIQFMTSIKLLHVSARVCHPQENFQIKGIQVLLEKLIGSQLAKKFPAFYGNPRFFTALTSAFLKY